MSVIAIISEETRKESERLLKLIDIITDIIDCLDSIDSSMEVIIIEEELL